MLKILKLVPVIIAAVICGLQCSSPTEFDPLKETRVIEAPTITGFYVTTVENPDGTGEVIGNPAYTVKEINVFPNPCRITLPPMPRYGHPFLTFTHLSDTVVILIFRGKSLQEAVVSERLILGIPEIQSSPRIVKRIEKNSTICDYFCVWDLKDNEGKYVTSGYYRAYFYGPKISPRYFLDFALEIEESYLEQY